MFLQRLHDTRHLPCPLPDGAVDTDDVRILLVDDGVDGDGGLTRAPVPDDELSLSPTDGDHGVDGFESGLKRLFHRLPQDDPGGYHIDLPGSLDGIDGPQSVHGLTQGIHDPAEVAGSGRDRENVPGQTNLIPFLEMGPLP